MDAEKQKKSGDMSPEEPISRREALKRMASLTLAVGATVFVACEIPGSYSSTYTSGGYYSGGYLSGSYSSGSYSSGGYSSRYGSGYYSQYCSGSGSLYYYSYRCYYYYRSYSSTYTSG